MEKNVINVSLFNNYNINMNERQLETFKDLRKNGIDFKNRYQWHIDEPDNYGIINKLNICVIEEMVYKNLLTVSDKFWIESQRYYQHYMENKSSVDELYFDNKVVYFITKERYKRVGIYVLYKGSRIVYIGKSNNPSNRICQHKSTNKDFDSFKIIVFEDTWLINLYEPYLIQKYQPKYNNDLLEEFKYRLPEISSL